MYHRVDLIPSVLNKHTKAKCTEDNFGRLWKCWSTQYHGYLHITMSWMFSYMHIIYIYMSISQYVKYVPMKLLCFHFLFFIKYLTYFVYLKALVRDRGGSERERERHTHREIEIIFDLLIHSLNFHYTRNWTRTSIQISHKTEMESSYSARSSFAAFPAASAAKWLEVKSLELNWYYYRECGLFKQQLGLL